MMRGLWRLLEQARRGQDILLTGSGTSGPWQRSRRCLDGQLLAQDLQRQAQVDRPFWTGLGDGQGAIHQVSHLFGESQFAIPFHGFPDHGTLIPHLLAPVDRCRTAAPSGVLGHRRAAGHDEHGNLVGRRVDDSHERVREPDVGMDHHRLGPAGCKKVTVRQCDRRGLVRHDDRSGRAVGLPAPLGKRLDDRCRIRSGIGEEIVDSVRFEARQEIICCRRHSGHLG